MSPRSHTLPAPNGAVPTAAASNGSGAVGSATAPSPPARRMATARWLDPRLLVGIMLVLVAVAVGAKVMSDAQGGELVWAATRALPAGSTLRADDLEARSVRLDDAGPAYIDASGPVPSGYVVVRSIGPGELIPVGAVSDHAAVDPSRLVSVPVELNHFPAGLARGDRVDVYVVRGAGAGTTTEQTDTDAELVLQDAVVADVSGSGGGLGSASTTIGVVLSVAPDDVRAVVQAVGIGSIQLALIPNQAP